MAADQKQGSGSGWAIWLVVMAISALLRAVGGGSSESRSRALPASGRGTWTPPVVQPSESFQQHLVTPPAAAPEERWVVLRRE